MNRLNRRLSQWRASTSTWAKATPGRIRKWWTTQPTLAKRLFILWVLTIAVFIQSDHHNQGCFREYFSVQTYRATKTDQIIEALRDAVKNQGKWTYDLSHPPENLWGNYGPERQHWLTGVGRDSTDRSNALVAKVNKILDDKAEHPYPVARCGAPG